MNLHDVSLPISNNLPVWPGDAAVSLITTMSISKGNKCNLTRIKMGTHAGTHIDAPSHFIQDGATVDSISFETLIGPCIVVELDSKALIEKRDFQNHNLDGHSRVSPY